MKTFLQIIVITFITCGINLVYGQNVQEQGIYFKKKEYVSQSFPQFENTRNKLPQPIYEENQSFVDCYWKTWEIAFDNFYEPTPQNGFVSQYADAAFSNSIFLWDMCFITMFTRYGAPFVPGIEGLDNFYAKQHSDGEICRQISRITGKDDKRWTNTENEPLFSRFGVDYFNRLKMPIIYQGRETPEPNPKLTLEGLNHPILAWAELESFQLTADTNRLIQVWLPLVHYYQALKKYLRQGNGLYVTDWSQMDNSPRNLSLMYGGTAVDISAEMVLFARNLSTIAQIIGKKSEAEEYKVQADTLSHIINEKMWNSRDKFYYDLTLVEKQIPIKTIGAYWSLIAGVADNKKAAFLIHELDNRNTFNRTHRVPTLSADERGYRSTGGYWKGSVWAPTNTMVIRGLEKYSEEEKAAEIALNHLKNVVQVYKNTGTIWENYAPDTIMRGIPSRPDFVGWSGIAPINYLIEYAIGIKANAPARLIEWIIRSEQRVGIENFRFGEIVVNLICNKPDNNGNRMIEVKSNKNFELKIKYNDKEITKTITNGESIRFNL